MDMTPYAARYITRYSDTTYDKIVVDTHTGATTPVDDAEFTPDTHRRVAELNAAHRATLPPMPASLTVYRVCRDSLPGGGRRDYGSPHVGPYNGGAEGALDAIGGGAAGSDTHPSPFLDGIGHDDMTADHVCGFLTPAMAVAWFTQPTWTPLDERGFTVRAFTVPTQDVTLGRRQVVFLHHAGAEVARWGVSYFGRKIAVSNPKKPLPGV